MPPPPLYCPSQMGTNPHPVWPRAAPPNIGVVTGNPTLLSPVCHPSPHAKVHTPHSSLCSCRASPIPPHVALISTQRTSVKTTNYVDTRAEFTQTSHTRPFPQIQVYLGSVIFLQVWLCNTLALNLLRYAERCVNNTAFG